MQQTTTRLRKTYRQYTFDARLIFSIILCGVISSLSAQNNAIKGQLVDSITKNHLALATITVYNRSDTSLIKYRLSDPEGRFLVAGVPADKDLYMVISYAGYQSFKRAFRLLSDSTLDVGIVPLSRLAGSLEEVIVQAEIPPVIFRNDTIEFNAPSFKTLPDAFVEDLLRKLPGVMVDREGNITVNGRKVNRLLVDGKIFFGNNLRMATRNLPANIIQKVQVSDDMQELKRRTGDNTAAVGKVINLQLKKNIKKGWFGKTYAGYGTNDRNEAGGIANLFRDTLQISLLGYINNVNRSSFNLSDIQNIGGFNRSGIKSMAIMKNSSNEGYSINGVSFGGTDEGMAKSTGTGFNLNHAPNSKVSFYVQYFFGNNRNNRRTVTREQQLINDTVLTTSTARNAQLKYPLHTINGGFSLKPDAQTDLSLDVSANIGKTSVNAFDAGLIENNMYEQIVERTGRQLETANLANYSHNFFLTKTSKKKQGRTLNLTQQVEYSHRKSETVNDNLINVSAPQPFVNRFDQLRIETGKTLRVSSTVNLTSPISRFFVLQWNNSHEYIREPQTINTYSNDTITGSYTIKLDSLSTAFARTQNRYKSNLAVSYIIKQVSINTGISAFYQFIRTPRKSMESYTSNLFDVLPSVDVKIGNFSTRFFQTITVPAANFLIPVQDNTNPFYIVYGNDNLQPAKVNSLEASMFHFNRRSSTLVNFILSGSSITNDIILSRIVDTLGVQKTIPVNQNGTKRIGLAARVQKDFKNQKNISFNFAFSPAINYENKRIIVNGKLGTSKYLNFSPSISSTISINDVVEFRPDYTISFSKSSYTNAAFSNLEVVTQNFLADLLIRWPRKLTWQSNINYRFNNIVAPGLPRSNTLWNFAVATSFIRNDKAQLKLSVFDLLGNNNSYERTISENYYYDKKTDVLQRYFLLTLTYNFNELNSTSEKKNRLFLF